METNEAVQLTPHQEKILRDIGDGMTQREIAEKHGISERTVKSYVELLRHKFGSLPLSRNLIPIARDYFAGRDAA